MKKTYCLQFDSRTGTPYKKEFKRFGQGLRAPGRRARSPGRSEARSSSRLRPVIHPAAAYKQVRGCAFSSMQTGMNVQTGRGTRAPERRPVPIRRLSRLPVLTPFASRRAISPGPAPRLRTRPSPPAHTRRGSECWAACRGRARVSSCKTARGWRSPPSPP